MNEKEILDSTVFMTLGGSHAYGTNTPESDVDRRGVCIPQNRNLYFGFPRHNFEQKDKWESGEDKTVYDFRKAVDLMLGGNPNMVDLLFTPECFWEHVQAPWLELLEHRESFLSAKMRHTYGGYAFAQLKRIKHHRNYLLNPPKKRPERADFGLPERKPVSNDDLQAFVWLATKLLENSIEHMNLSEETKADLAGVNFIGLMQSRAGDTDLDTLSKLTGMPDSFVDICMREKRYMSACNAFESYQRWKTERNPKRAATEAKYGYDTKHAMHLVRLMRMGMEILGTGKVNVFREDREELLDIRRGAWSYEELEQYAQDSDKELASLYIHTKLPKVPPVVQVEALCTRIVEKQLQWHQPSISS